MFTKTAIPQGGRRDGALPVRWLAGVAIALATGAAALPSDILPEHGNRAVTRLCEDAESVRLALGAAWDDALACRAMVGYLAPWQEDTALPLPDAEEIVARGARLYERVKGVDDGVSSVRLARDARQPGNLDADIAFWRNELALAARDVSAYVADSASLRQALEQRLRDEAAARGLSRQRIDGMPWSDHEREAWRQAGPATGVRLPLPPRPGSLPDWWNRNLSLEPGYLVSKLGSAGEEFFTPEVPVAAWGTLCTGPGQYDWSPLDR